MAGSDKIKLKIVSPSGQLIDTVPIREDDTVYQFKNAILLSSMGIRIFHAHSIVEAYLRPTRQRLTLRNVSAKSKPVVLEDKQLISKYGLKEGDEVILKDLGPQISWRTVFIFEYLGPLLIHQLFFYYYLNKANYTFHLTQMYPSRHYH